MNKWIKVKSSRSDVLLNGKNVAIINKSRGVYWGKAYINYGDDKPDLKYLFTFPPQTSLKALKKIIEENSFFSKEEKKSIINITNQETKRYSKQVDCSNEWWQK